MVGIGNTAAVVAPVKCNEALCNVDTFDMEYGQSCVVPYIPQNLTIRPGANVTFVNKGKDAHTATYGPSPLYGGRIQSEKTFDTGLIQPGRKASIKTEKAGEYPYYCALHP